jgi:hypothetical protein
MPNTPASAITVRIGNQDQGTGGDFHTVTDVISDPAYTGATLYLHDQALLHLGTASANTPIRLAQPGDNTWFTPSAGGRDIWAIATGWGLTSCPTAGTIASPCPDGTPPTSIQRTIVQIMTPDPNDLYGGPRS